MRRRAYVTIDRQEADALVSNPVPVYLNADYKHRIGDAHVKRVNDVLMASFTLIRPLPGYYPSGTYILMHGTNDQPSKKKLVALSLSVSPNIDPKIKPLP